VHHLPSALGKLLLPLSSNAMPVLQVAVLPATHGSTEHIVLAAQYVRNNSVQGTAAVAAAAASAMSRADGINAAVKLKLYSLH
jgi:hypothetical protein